MPYADKYVRQATDVPDTEHWVIVRTDGVYIPGDERSRTNPGHGYPAETKNFLSYQVYFTQEKLLEAIKELEEPKYGGKREPAAHRKTTSNTGWVTDGIWTATGKKWFKKRRNKDDRLEKKKELEEEIKET